MDIVLGHGIRPLRSLAGHDQLPPTAKPTCTPTCAKRPIQRRPTSHAPSRRNTRCEARPGWRVCDTSATPSGASFAQRSASRALWFAPELGTNRPTSDLFFSSRFSTVISANTARNRSSSALYRVSASSFRGARCASTAAHLAHLIRANSIRKLPPEGMLPSIMKTGAVYMTANILTRQY